ncbi:hypothetical protein ACHAQA_007202 [Verticillium albo-atrum]
MTLLLRAGPAPPPGPSTSSSSCTSTGASTPSSVSTLSSNTPTAPYQHYPQAPAQPQEPDHHTDPAEDVPPPPPTLPTLPPELQSLITVHLSYPDALSLKHTNRHFFKTTDTGVRLKIAWLLERRALRLECPSCGRGCDLASDVGFCRGGGGHVGRVIRRRRMHGECESRDGLGCVVLGTGRCERRRERMRRVRRGVAGVLGWMRVLVLVVPVLAVLWAFLGGKRGCR